MSALAIAVELGDRYREGGTRFALALATDALGDRDAAVRHLEQALAVFVSLDSPTRTVGTSGEVVYAALVGGGQQLAAVTNDAATSTTTLTVRDVNTGVVSLSRSFPASARGAAFDPIRGLAAISTHAGGSRVQLVDLATGAVTEVPGTEDHSEAVGISESGRYVAVGTNGGTVVVYDRTTGQSRSLTGLTRTVTVLAWGHGTDGLLAAADDNAHLALFSPMSSQPLSLFSSPYDSDRTTGLQFSSNNLLLFRGAVANGLLTFDASNPGNPHVSNELPLLALNGARSITLSASGESFFTSAVVSAGGGATFLTGVNAVDPNSTTHVGPEANAVDLNMVQDDIDSNPFFDRGQPVYSLLRGIVVEIDRPIGRLVIRSVLAMPDGTSIPLFIRFEHLQVAPTLGLGVQVTQSGRVGTIDLLTDGTEQGNGHVHIRPHLHLSIHLADVNAPSLDLSGWLTSQGIRTLVDLNGTDTGGELVADRGNWVPIDPLSIGTQLGKLLGFVPVSSVADRIEGKLSAFSVWLGRQAQALGSSTLEEFNDKVIKPMTKASWRTVWTSLWNGSTIEQAFGRVPGINTIVFNRVMTSATLKAVVAGGLVSFGVDVVYDYLNPNLVDNDAETEQTLKVVGLVPIVGSAIVNLLRPEKLGNPEDLPYVGVVRGQVVFAPWTVATSGLLEHAAQQRDRKAIVSLMDETKRGYLSWKTDNYITQSQLNDLNIYLNRVLLQLLAP